MKDEVTQEALAMKIACRAVADYGEGDGHEHLSAKKGKLWRDHPAYQAALAAIKASEERATLAERERCASMMDKKAEEHAQQAAHADAFGYPDAFIRERHFERLYRIHAAALRQSTGEGGDHEPT